MLRKILFLVCLLWTGNCINSLAQSLPDTVYDIVIAAGQSNMVGRDSVIYSTADSALPGMYQLRRNYTIGPADQPLDYVGVKPKNISPAFYFARRILEERNPAIYSGNPVIIIPAAIGGTGFSDNQWNVGDTLYRNTITRVKHIMAKYPGSTIKAILWQQGEVDNFSRDNAVYLYRYRLATMITGMRKELNCPTAPFIAGHLYNQNKTVSPVMYHNIQSLETDNLFCGVISRDGLEDVGDNVHFNAASLKIMGQRYYDEFFEASQRNRNLLVHYKGDMTSGIVKDATENKLDANASSVTSKKDNGLGNILELNYDALPLNIMPFINALEYGTVSFLFRTSRNGSMSFFSSQNPVTGDYIELFMNDGKVGSESFCNGISRTVQSTTAFNDGQWHRLVYRNTPQDAALYIDDYVLPDTNNGNRIFFGYGFDYGFTQATIGARFDNNKYKYFYNGSLADFRIYRDYEPAYDTTTVAITKPDIICRNQPTVFTMQPSNTGKVMQYQWYRNSVLLPGATDSIYTAELISQEQEETIEVVAYNLESIAGAAMAIDTVQVKSRREDLLLPPEISCSTGASLVYPNPSSGTYNILTDKEILAVVKDMQGRTVLQKKVVRVLDLNNCATGIYLLMLYNDEKGLIGMQKIIKN